MVSIIVPVYNAGTYLEKCVDSILGQTYRDMQIILVDDGSVDASGERCDEYEKTDARVFVIHKTNGGSTSARKAGLKAAKGEWIGFVDADDWIEHDYIEKMVTAQRDTGADMIVSNHFHDIGEDAKKVCSNFPIGVYTKEELMPTLLYAGRFYEYGLQPHMVTKLFRKEMIQKQQMAVDERIVLGEDAAVVYPSVLEAGKIYVSDICGYHYVQHPHSITKIEIPNETGIYWMLFAHLERAFRDKGVWELMEPQLAQYKKYLLFMRRMSVFDAQVLIPYGGIPKDSNVILYGAGVMGQKMYQYLSQIHDMDILLWVDKNYPAYREKGFPVVNPEEILSMQQYDYILIANTVQKTADSIRRYLSGMGIADHKILWFSKEFIHSGLNRIDDVCEKTDGMRIKNCR